MTKAFIDNEEFLGMDYTENPLAKGDYEDCTFASCTFTNSDLSTINFAECEFINCDLSMAKVDNTAFKTARFKECKMLGVRFDTCNPFLLELEFEKCQLNLASFYQLKLKGTRFISCQLQEVDFVNTNLAGAFFSDCDLLQAVFDNTILERADFRTACNYALDPEANYIQKAKFSREGVLGLLNKYDIEIE